MTRGANLVEVERTGREDPGAAPVAVGRALARLSRLLEQASSAAGLTLAQYRVLVLVAQRPERASALAAKADVQRATLSAIVAGLERGGLLAREPVAEDGRGVRLRLTEHGASQLAAVERELGERLRAACEAGGCDPEALAGLLGAVLVGFETTCGGSST
ncbi:MarR family winged helix-turn-helix transcriptional regulator [Aciditerrimonas ferrireducens]|uniref:MarR family winged helix-turn-helix transcriptional regulator n=1 Tax=Aciditerrimonas ferrireducens TaxID=667306 RepID=A0ABV6C200_9ACTN|nr:MarR family transcriptional regulator [Aciditerrimonas ferrireducens]MCK4176577.1 MarR family transcriptional regulator [Aciditerrimonas ferrireducens]